MQGRLAGSPRSWSLSSRGCRWFRGSVYEGTGQCCAGDVEMQWGRWQGGGALFGRWLSAGSGSHGIDAVSVGTAEMVGTGGGYGGLVSGREKSDEVEEGAVAVQCCGLLGSCRGFVWGITNESYNSWS